MSIPITRQHGSPGVNKRRTEIMDELRIMSIEFMRDPTMAFVDRMEALRAEQTELERNVVKFVCNRKMFALMMEEQDNRIETVSDDEVIEATDDAYEESPSVY